jgi:hypothetical protein
MRFLIVCLTSHLSFSLVQKCTGSGGLHGLLLSKAFQNVDYGGKGELGLPVLCLAYL